MSMGDKSDGSKSDPESLGRVTISSRKFSKRTLKRRRKQQQWSDSSDDEHPQQPKRRNRYRKLKKLPGDNRSSVQNSISSASDISYNNQQILPEETFRNILSADPKILPNCVKNSQCSEFERKNSTLIATVTDTSSSDSSEDLNSFKNLEQTLCIIHQTESLLQDQPNLRNYVETSSRKESNFQPSDIFRNLLSPPKKSETKGSFCKWKVFQPNCSLDVLLEDKHILQDIRTVFKSESKLKESTSQTETLNTHRTVNKDTFQHHSDQDNQDFYDWDKFLERWEGMHIVPASSSKPQCCKHKILKKTVVCLPPTSSVIGTKRKKQVGERLQPIRLNGQAKKRFRTAGHEATRSSLNSISSEREHNSNKKCVLPSSKKDMARIIHPVSLDNSKKIISFDHASLPNGTNGFVLPSGSYIHQKLPNLLNHIDNATSSTNNSTDKIEELTVVENNDTKMFS